MLRKTDERLLAGAERGLSIRGLGKSFHRAPVLNGIDLDVRKGELITVLGPSGSGKTTLLRLLCGFERADEGCIEFGNRKVAHGRTMHLAPEKRGIGYVAQEGALFPHLSVQENLLFGLPRRIRRAGARQKGQRVGELLELVDLPARYANRKPAALSGGEQQRLALARALAPGPAIVLLDEPFSALDAGLRAGLRATITAILKRAKVTALLVTHDQDEALSMGDRVAVLQNGRFAQVDTPQVLYRFPANRAIARFVGDAVLVPATAAAGMAECCFGRLPIAPEAGNKLEGTVDIMIRPEQFRLYSLPGDELQVNGAVRGTACVEHLQFHGHDAQIGLRMNDGQQFMAKALGFEIPALGENVHFQTMGSVVAYPRHE